MGVRIFERFAKPVLVVIGCLGLLSVLILATGPEPNLVRVPGGTVKAVLVVCLSIFSAAGPLIYSTRAIAATRLGPLAVVAGASGMVNSAALGPEVRLPLQTACSGVAEVLSLVLCVLAVNALAVRRDGSQGLAH